MRLLIGIVALAQAGLMGTASPAPDGPDRLRDIESVIEEAIRQWEVPGLGVGVLVDGRPAYARGFGVRDVERHQPVTPRTVFPIGGCAEPFTALLLSMLHERGTVDLDGPAADQLGVAAPAESVLRRLTPRDFLSHRTGLPGGAFARPGDRRTRAEIVAGVAAMQPVPGIRTAFQDSWLNVVVAEHLVERATRRPWEVAIQEQLFEALSMTASSFGVEGLQEADDAVRPHALHDGRLVPVDLAGRAPMGAAGWINSSVEDLMRWLSVYVNDGAQEGVPMVSPASIRAMIEPHAFVYWNRTPAYTPTTYGLSWGMNTFRGAYHARLGGFGDGFEALVSFLPRERIGVVLLANRGDDTITLLTALKFVILDRLLGAEERDWVGEAWDRVGTSRPAPRRTPATIRLPEERLADYAGTYRHPALGALRLSAVAGRLMLRIDGLAVPLDCVAPDVFQAATESVGTPLRALSIRSFRFDRTDGGAVAALRAGAHDDNTVFTRASP